MSPAMQKYANMHGKVWKVDSLGSEMFQPEFDPNITHSKPRPALTL